MPAHCARWLVQLPLMVLFITVTCALLAYIPPPRQLPKLLLIVVPVTVSVAPSVLEMPPPLLAGTIAAELLTMLLSLIVSPPWFRMPPPLPSTGRPFVIVKPEIVTFEAKFSSTRNVALPLTARFPAPEPLMVTLWVT